MTTELIVRKANQQDAEPLAELAKANMPGYPFNSVYDPKALEAEILGGSNRLIAVDHDDIIHGTAVLGDDHMAEIKRVLVRHESRGRGIARALTTKLKAEALAKGVVPWADVRADQIGMQRAAHSPELMSLEPIAVEMGKHIVYVHPDGPARENMVGMSSLEIAKSKHGLTDHLGRYSTELASNMAEALSPKPKDIGLVSELLQSADLVKSQILRNLGTSRLPYTQLTPDILSVSSGDASCVIISPDASGFVSGVDPDSIIKLVDAGLYLGLQILTCYVSTANTELITKLRERGLRPGMIRPWQETSSHKPEWQVGLRKTANHYESSLHTVLLDASVREKLGKVIESIDALAKIYKGGKI
jgi:GNAT superfamily N-acetyltransferase